MPRCGRDVRHLQPLVESVEEDVDLVADTHLQRTREVLTDRSGSGCGRRRRRFPSPPVAAELARRGEVGLEQLHLLLRPAGFRRRRRRRARAEHREHTVDVGVGEAGEALEQDLAVVEAVRGDELVDRPELVVRARARTTR